MGRSAFRQRRLARRRSRDIPPAIPSATTTVTSPKSDANLERLDTSRTSESGLDEDTLRQMLEAAYTEAVQAITMVILFTLWASGLIYGFGLLEGELPSSFTHAGVGSWPGRGVR